MLKLPKEVHQIKELLDAKPKSEHDLIRKQIVSALGNGVQYWRIVNNPAFDLRRKQMRIFSAALEVPIEDLFVEVKKSRNKQLVK